MRVILMHNAGAGASDHTARDLVKRIKAAGHEVMTTVTRKRDLTTALRKPCDVVAVAGGDGTVRSAGLVLGGTGVPFVVIPLGTANNIGRRLGFPLDVDAAIAAWDGSALAGFDRAQVRTKGDVTTFIEGLGFGVFADVLHTLQQQEDEEKGPRRVKKDRALFRETLDKAAARMFTVWADGEDLSGEYLMVEVLNTGWIGPNLSLAPDACPHDGRFDVALVGEEHRAALMRRAGPGKDAAARPFHTHAARHIVISTPARRYHQDGVLLPRRVRSHAHVHVEITVEPHALQALVPRKKVRG
jgi:diacylglycerol kinase (ATP)